MHFVRLAFLITLLIPLSCGARANSSRAPDATLARSLGAQTEFDSLAQRWRHSSDIGRLRLDPDLLAFLRRFESDPISRRVRIYLAWNALARGEPSRAERFIVSVSAGPPGADRDLAQIVAAAVALQRGQPSQAMSLLAPLEGKIIDAGEQALYNEQRALAALAAQQWDEAVSALERWLKSAPMHQTAATEKRVGELLGSLPVAEQSRQLDAMNQRLAELEADSPSTQHVRWLRDSLEQRLVVSALQRRDAALAQRLVEGQRRWNSSPERAAMLELAGEASVDARISGRTIGLAINVDDPLRQQISAAIVEGLMLALGLPAANASADAPVLLVREVEQGSRMVRTLNALAGDGAAVLIAGVDQESADFAAKYVETDTAPLLLLATPTQPLAKGLPIFSLGLPKETEVRAANEALVSLGVEQAVFVGVDGRCEPEEGAGRGQFPTQEWEKERIDGFALLGGPECTRRLVRALQTTRLRPAIVFGLQSGSSYGRSSWRGPKRWLQVGDFPGVTEASESEAPPKKPPIRGWYQSLGHDAGTLALAALTSLPDAPDQSRASITRLHREVTQALRHADVSLLTTDAHGFANGSAIARRIRDTDLPGEESEAQFGNE